MQAPQRGDERKKEFSSALERVLSDVRAQSGAKEPVEVLESEKVNVLVATANPSTCREVKRLLAGHPNFELLATCSAAVEIVRVLRSRPVDVVFTELRLPDLELMEILEIAGASARPGALVVISEDESGAFSAIEAGAADFLKLPVSRVRFDTALRRALIRLAARRPDEPGPSEAVHEIEEKLRGLRRNGFPDRLVARVGDRWQVIATDDIDFVQSEGNYAILHCGESKYRVRETLGHLEGQLDPGVFFRVHRSSIVRLDRVVDLVHVKSGEYRIHLVDGSELELTRVRRDEFLAALEGVGHERPVEPS